MKRLFVVLTVLLLILVLSVQAFSQSSNASLSGTVADASGAVIPGVKITATNTGTGVINTAVSNNSGIYSFPSLLPGNYKVAADYLQLSSARRQSQGAEAAKRLKVLMDRAFVGNPRRLSTRPEGNPENGINDQQTIGTFSSGDVDVPVVLVRVSDPDSGKIWVFSAETLSKVPELYDNLQSHQIEKDLPQSLVQNLILGMPLWQWLALLAALPVAAGIGWLMVVSGGWL